jgi:hypothetical protein
VIAPGAKSEFPPPPHHFYGAPPQERDRSGGIATEARLTFAN